MYEDHDYENEDDYEDDDNNNVWGDEEDYAVAPWEVSNDNTGGGGDNGSNNLYNDRLLISGRNHCLVLLDCDGRMFDNTGENGYQDPEFPNETIHAIDGALIAFETIVRQRLRTMVIHKTSKHDGFGVLLYNTKYRTPIIPKQEQEENDEENEDDEHAKKKILKGDDDDDNDDQEDEDDEDDTMGGFGRPTARTYHEFIPLKPPGITAIQKIQAARDHPFNGRELDLETEYKQCNVIDDDNDEHQQDDQDGGIVGHLSQTIPLQLALHESINIFRKADCVQKPPSSSSNKSYLQARDTKQIWILTCNDNPLSSLMRTTKTDTKSADADDGKDKNDNDDPQALQMLQLIQRTAEDVRENGIEIYVWPLVDMKYEKQKFVYETFYKHIGAIIPNEALLDMDEDDDEDYKENDNEQGSDRKKKSLDLDALIDQMQHGWKKVRKGFCIPMLLPDWKQQQHQQQQQSNNHHEEENDIEKKESSQVTVTNEYGGGGDDDDNKNDRAISNNSASTNTKPPTSIMLDFYRMVDYARKATKVKIHRKTGRVLIRETQTVTAGEDTQEILERRGNKRVPRLTTNRLRTFVLVGQQKHRVPITKQDQLAIKEACNSCSTFASLILIGFKPIDSIPFYHTLDKSYFVYPTPDDDEGNGVQGSTAAFAHLHGSMLNKNVLAIGELLPKVTSISRLVAMFPLQEEFVRDDDGDVVIQRPPGLAVVELPYEDEVRDFSTLTERESNPNYDISVVSEDMVEAASNLIKNLTIKNIVIGEDLQNPEIAPYWKHIETLALGPSWSSPDDNVNKSDIYDTIVNEEMIRNKAGKEIDVLLSLLPDDVEIEKQTKKRELPPDDSGIDWEEAFWEGAIGEYKLPELKVFLKSRGLPLGGKKADLVERVMGQVEEEVKKKKVKVEGDDTYADDFEVKKEEGTGDVKVEDEEYGDNILI